MHNWYGIETEAEFRRQEWQRLAEADARAALAGTVRGESGRGRVPHGFLARLRALGAPRWPIGAPAAPRRPAAYSAK
jgi:hypothetical protein